MHKYILDLKNIISEKSVINSLTQDFSVEKKSDRTFVLSGPQLFKSHLIGCYLNIDEGGHIFYFDCQTTEEYSLRKIQGFRKKHRLQDADLDTQTLQQIEQTLNDLKEDFDPVPHLQ